MKWHAVSTILLLHCSPGSAKEPAMVPDQERSPGSSGMVAGLFLQPLRSRRGWVVYVVAMALVAPVYFTIGQGLVWQTNQDVGASDQLANIWLARDAAGDWYPHRSSYIQPLWPWVSGWVSHADDNTYFRNGKRLNLWFGFAMMVVLFVVGAAALAPVPGYVLGLLGGMGALLQRAHYFHPEPLLYGFFAAAGLLMVLTFFRNSWWFYAGWGICLGLAYLAKASVGPLLVVYIGATAVLALARCGLLPRWLTGQSDAGEWGFSRHVVGTLVGILLAVSVIAPNLAFKYRVHDDPLFSPAKYWMWCDDWDTEAYPLYERLWTAQSRAGFPPGELPTAGNYLRKHGWAHAAKRLANGLHVMGERFLVPTRKVPTALFWQMQGGVSDRAEPPKVWRYTLPARGLYLILLTAMVAFLWIDRGYRDGLPLFRNPGALAATAFVVALTLGYWLAFGWYAVIGKGERFSLMLYLPLLMALLTAGWSLARSGGRRAVLAYAATLSLVLIHAVVQIARILFVPQFGRSLAVLDLWPLYRA